MIIEFEPGRTLLSSPPKWRVFYKEEYEQSFREMIMGYNELKKFLETYGYETNDIFELKKFGIETKNIKQNIKL